MRKTLISVFILISIVFTASGCGQTDSAEVPQTSDVPKIEVTPEPMPTATPEAEIEINGKKVKEIELRNGYSFELFGQEVNTATTTRLDYLQVPIGDEGLEEFRKVLPYMDSLEYLSFDRCDTTDEAVAALRDEFPDKKIVWRVFFGPFSCMTDVEKIWASCDLYDGMTDSLKYCNDVKYLDVGHGPLTDYSFLQYMPDLEVLIISCGDVSDCTPVKYCKNLIFLEAAETRLVDLSPIANCTKLEYLNVGGNQKMDIKSLRKLYTLPNLKRFYCENFYSYAVNMTDEQKEVEKLMPNCEVDFSWNGDTALNSKWRRTQGVNQGGYNSMYQWIRDIFEYDNPYGSTRLYPAY